MKIGIVGSGGREHAIAWSINNEKKHSICTFPGNGGTALISDNIESNDHDLLEQILKEKCEMVIIGPEVPLAEGLANKLREKNIITFGPGKKGAMIEKSKVWAKKFMNKYNIPTAEHEVFENYDRALNYIINKNNYPVVIKADGLAAGKGVFIPRNREEAEESLDTIMVEGKFGKAGDRVEIEEYLEGIEASYLVFVDGDKFKPMVTSKDYKQLLDGNRGPNTGGMGTFSPSPHIDSSTEEFIQNNIIKKAINGFLKEGIDYRGVLYAGLMLTQDGPKVLEFNCRFGDPETQVILPRLVTPLSEIVHAVEENSLDKIELKWRDNSTVCLIAASDGYPLNYEKGKKITGFERVKNSIIFHAGTELIDDNFYTSGGRVLGVTSTGSSISEARKKVYNDMNKITFEGIYYRSDIGKI